MNIVDCKHSQHAASPKQPGRAVRSCSSTHLSPQRAAPYRLSPQPCRVTCGANNAGPGRQRCGSGAGPLAAISGAAQHTGIRPVHGVARQSASAASADFASGAAEDFRSADMVADGSTPIAPLSPVAASAAAQSKGLSGLAARIVFGTALGVAGALVILTGGWCYMISACFVAYQASREYFGFLTSKVLDAPKCIEAWLPFVQTSPPDQVYGNECVIVLQGISQGMQPPPPLVTTLTTLCCIGLVVWTFISQGKSTAALAVAALLVLSLQLLATEKPRFAQLTSSVFGLFYCGG